MPDIAVPFYYDSSNIADSCVSSVSRANELQQHSQAGQARGSTTMTQREESSEEDKPLTYSTNTTSKIKSKRKQNSSCDACRLRKVKCIRSELQAECNSCFSKNIACTRVFSQEHVHGKGKRIAQAREEFGSSAASIKTNASSSSSSSSPVDMLQIQSTTVHKMNDHVLSAKALCAFLCAYEADVASAIPGLEYARLFQACHQVHFDIDALDEVDRILCIAAAGVAANVQQADRKFGKGQSAITINDPVAVKKDLEIRVFEEADRIGILRKPSARSLEVLRLFCVLSSAENAREGRRSDSYRIYEQALVEHLRSLSESGQVGEQKTAELFWSLILGDSFACALSGRSPSFTSDDIQNFASYVDYSTPGMLAIISQMDLTSAEAGFGLIFAGICQLCRAFYQRVTSALARKRPFVDVEMMEEIPLEMERLIGVTAVCEQRLNVLFGPDNWPEHMAYWVRVARFLYGFILVMALDELEVAIVKELSSNVSLRRLQTLQQTMEMLQLRAMDEIKYNTGWKPQPGASRIFATADGLLAFFAVLRVRRIFKLPSVEEGACLGAWTMAEKLESARYYMKFCEYLGESVPEVALELDTLRKGVQLLEQKAKTFTNEMPTLLKASSFFGLSQTQPTAAFSGFDTSCPIPQASVLSYREAPRLAEQNASTNLGYYRFEDIANEATPPSNPADKQTYLPRLENTFLTDALRPGIPHTWESFSSSSESEGTSLLSPDLQFEQFLNTL